MMTECSMPMMTLSPDLIYAGERQMDANFLTTPAPS